MYSYINDLPLLVINIRTGRELFFVIPPDWMEVNEDAVSTKNVNK